MENAKSFEAKLARLFKATKTQTDTALADILEIRPQSIAAARKRQQIPSGWIEKIAAMFNVNANWLFFGRGPMFIISQEEPESVSQESHTVDCQQDKLLLHSTFKNKMEMLSSQLTDFFLIPMVEAVLSAGTGSFETEGSSERKYAFRYDFLHRKGNPQEMVLMRVSGDSMEPEIKHGDVVLIDQSQKTMPPKAICAVGVEDMVFLKRISAKPGQIILTSDNKEYEPMVIDTTEQLDGLVRIIGRVVWISREV